MGAQWSGKAHEAAIEDLVPREAYEELLCRILGHPRELRGMPPAKLLCGPHQRPQGRRPCKRWRRYCPSDVGYWKRALGADLECKGPGSPGTVVNHGPQDQRVGIGLVGDASIHCPRRAGPIAL